MSKGHDKVRSQGPTFSAESYVWRGSGGRGKPVTVVVDRAAGLIHFQNCAVRMPFLLGGPLPWFSCSLSDLRCFHVFFHKYEYHLVLKTNIGKVTILIASGDLRALIQTLSDLIPGGHRRFHEDSFLAIPLYLLAGVSAAGLVLFVVPEWLSPNTQLSLVLGSGVVVAMAVRQAISFWTGKPSQKR